MKSKNSRISIGMALFLFLGCGSSSTSEIENPPIPTDRVLQFSGMEWIVRTTREKKEGPGPNIFSDSEKNVWVDNEGRLHLKVTQEGGNWYCSGITSKKSYGYGKYTIYVNSDVTTLDQHVVAGLFTYYNDDEEIDIEFSKWSIPDNHNAQFASQPSSIAGNKKRFNIGPGLGQTTHSFDWQSNQIFFKSSYRDNNGTESILQEWNYEGPHIPKERREKLKLNLWLFKGQIPSDLKEQEIVIDSVRYVEKK